MGDEEAFVTQKSAPIRADDASLVAQIAKVVDNRKAMVPPADRRARNTRARADEDLSIRLGLLESPRSDPNGFERIIGESDLLSINFLDRGRRAADAVCRLKLPMDGGMAYGTGFLVGPRLLLTNNHVIASTAEAAQSEAEFGYEHDLDGVVKEAVAFNLDPHSLFFTSPELDFTLVAVAPLASSGVPIERYGWLPLIPLSGKTVDGEWVSAIQHPDGQPKQIAIHASQIIKLDCRSAVSPALGPRRTSLPRLNSSPSENISRITPSSERVWITWRSATSGTGTFGPMMKPARM